MRLVRQREWMELLNAQLGVEDQTFFERVVPSEAGRFEDPPGWPRPKARTYLVNHIELLRSAHRTLESGDRPDLSMLARELGAAELTLDVAEGLAARCRDRDRNPGTLFVRDLVARALLAFARYVDYRVADPAWPDATTDRFQVRICIRPGCERVFIRGPDRPLYCSEDCQREDR